MSKWTHVFIGPADLADDIESEVVSVGRGSLVHPARIQDGMAAFNSKPGCEHVRYVGSGKGDWWDRTMNEDDPLVERFQIRNLTAGMIPMGPLAAAGFPERLP